VSHSSCQKIDLPRQTLFASDGVKLILQLESWLQRGHGPQCSAADVQQ
jgi:hypothetical protein